MPEVDINCLLLIVVGVQLNAELGDRPLAYRIEREIKQRLPAMIGMPEPGHPPKLAPAVISDVYYLNSEEAQTRPTICIGGPGVNGLTALLVDQIPHAVSIEDSLVVQMDLELNDLRCAIWGMNHLDTVRAIDLFVSKGYLETFLQGAVAAVD
jgi:hypothetical protein